MCAYNLNSTSYSCNLQILQFHWSYFSMQPFLCTCHYVVHQYIRVSLFSLPCKNYANLWISAHLKNAISWLEYVRGLILRNKLSIHGSKNIMSLGKGLIAKIPSVEVRYIMKFWGPKAGMYVDVGSWTYPLCNLWKNESSISLDRGYSYFPLTVIEVCGLAVFYGNQFWIHY